MALKLVPFILFILEGCSSPPNLPIVQTPLGTIRGYHRTSLNGRTFTAFEGIPYAKPPIGDLRFEEPRPIDPWVGIWNASFLTTCTQVLMLEPNVTSGTEDCLHVNVFVPRDRVNPLVRFDVIVHIHGGGFMYGSGNEYSPPEVLMDRDVIFVTFNYRLGMLGFLSTEDGVVPGNNGLKDQVLALKWIKHSIASFGGNPESITITGLSAGGASVQLHFLSPTSRGLFKGGFSQSGSALNPWVIQENPLQNTKKLAHAVGCPTDNTRLLVKCLKQRPFEQLLTKTSLFFSWSFLPVTPFGPVVEKWGPQPFLAEDPYILLKTGKTCDAPFLASNTKDEGFIFVMLANNTAVLDQKWTELIPSILDFRNTLPEPQWVPVSEKIRKFYFENDTSGLTRLFTDRFFTVGTEIGVRLQAKVTKSPVYYYSFGYSGDNNPQGFVSHASDAKYFFGPVLSPGPLTPNELKMKDMLLDMLVSFAKSGRPVLGNIDWNPIGRDKLTYLKVDGVKPGEFSSQTVAGLTPVSFWDSLGLQEGVNLLKKHHYLHFP